MADKKLCPYTPAELAALYAGQTLQQIADALTAKGFPITASLVLGWLQQAGIPRRRVNATRKISCPFSPIRLRQMYVEEKKSMQEIGELARPLMPGRTQPLPQTMVTRWLREAGVPLRTSAEAQAAWVQQHPEQSRQRARAAIAARQPPIQVERLCAGCGLPVRCPPHRMRRERVFCCKSCAAVWGSTQRTIRPDNNACAPDINRF